MTKAVLEVNGLTKIFSNRKRSVTAVDNISFQLGEGECLGIVGESNSGKSTAVRMIMQLEDVTEGEIFYRGQDIVNCSTKEQKGVYRRMQMIFQNPEDSFDPKKKLGSSIAEVLCNYGMSRSEARLKIPGLLQRVGLEAEIALRYPHQVSGGQCQRAAIARAVALKPDILVCDEITSALDVSVQQQILELLKKLQEEEWMSVLFISHDLAVVQRMCQRVLVMHDGRVVEAGETNEVIRSPREVYTRELLDSVLSI